ncbi:hypothetical protein PMG11_07830 [Penicillium brasilianum]|uniref:Uncharacterized protein n=1 Tax=Penicillium brasilianum TaxID=104259 RepID=A0A0F7TR08_PENBI|nr:hypothetical protein PMG11_07830 [Penicillium brasilianum]
MRRDLTARRRHSNPQVRGEEVECQKGMKNNTVGEEWYTAQCQVRDGRKSLFLVSADLRRTADRVLSMIIGTVYEGDGQKVGSSSLLRACHHVIARTMDSGMTIRQIRVIFC